MSSSRQFLSIQQISQKLDIPKPTLRFWEKELDGVLVPLRTHGGQRRYAAEHVAVIKKIKTLKKAGLSLVEIKSKLGNGGMSETEIQGFSDGRMGAIDLLAERVTAVVKMEVLRFFQRGEG
ncbi:MAG: MerR family transcriptional regulator [Deltaproteobacteria bacterium]|nr:MerR family transcriptional regulator [Deltaproteobacteria bacterium]